MCALCKGARATVRATWSWCCVLSTGNRVGFRRYNSRLSNYPFSHGIPFRRNAIIERFTRSAEKSIEINNDSALAVPLRRNAKCLQPIFFYAQSIGHSWHKTISLARSCRTCSIFFSSHWTFFFSRSARHNFFFLLLHFAQNESISYNTNIGSRLVGSTFFFLWQSNGKE